MSRSNSTPLLASHQSAGARLVDFAGFQMPLQYSGIVDEHQAVRRAAGLFDVSHMGQLSFRGPQALAAVDTLVTNDIGSAVDGHAVYTPICQPDGGIVDDCIVYRVHREELLLIVNASNVAKDFAWCQRHAAGRCVVRDESDDFALLALQGPRAADILRSAGADQAADLARFGFTDTTVTGVPCRAARTGYTGEDGFELLCRTEEAETLWSTLRDTGGAFDLKPCGLGARDTLRLEAKLLLYDSDIDATTTPLEAGLRWTVCFDKPDFIGKTALLTQRNQGIERKLVGLVMRSRGIARAGHTVHRLLADGAAGEIIGRVTSGTKAPTVDQAIALAYVPPQDARAGTRLVVDVRGKPVAAEVVKGPFYRPARP